MCVCVCVLYKASPGSSLTKLQRSKLSSVLPWCPGAKMTRFTGTNEVTQLSMSTSHNISISTVRMSKRNASFVCEESWFFFLLNLNSLHDKEGGNQGKVQEPLEKGALTLCHRWIIHVRKVATLRAERDPLSLAM